MHRIRFAILLLAVMMCSPSVWAQIDPQSVDTTQQPADSLLVDLEETPDTFNFHYFYPDNPDAELSYKDTLIDGFQTHDPVRQQRWDYGMTGNLGGAHFPFVYQQPLRQGFEVGFRQFDLYKIKYETFPYYRVAEGVYRIVF